MTVRELLTILNKADENGHIHFKNNDVETGDYLTLSSVNVVFSNDDDRSVDVHFELYN